MPTPTQAPTPTKWVCNPFASVSVLVSVPVSVSASMNTSRQFYSTHFFIGVGVGQCEHVILKGLRLLSILFSFTVSMDLTKTHCRNINCHLHNCNTKPWHCGRGKVVADLLRLQHLRCLCILCNLHVLCCHIYTQKVWGQVSSHHLKSRM